MRPTRLAFSLALLAAVVLTGCAVAAGYIENKPPVLGDVKTILADHPCGLLPVDTNGGVDNAPGWVKDTAPSGMDPQASCHAKYNPPFYCASADCKTLVYKTLPKDPADRGKDWSFVIDMLGGDALACADQCNKFQWAVDRSALDCAWQPISGAGGAKRFTFTAKVPTDTKTSPAMCLYVKPALNPTAPPRIAIGQIGVAQRPTP